MRIVRSMLLGLFALACVVPSLATAAKPGAQATIGAQAPGFTLRDVEGKEHSLKDFRGKYVVLEWFNHECPFVKKHYTTGNMQKLQKEYVEKDVVWLTVNSSAPGKQGHLTAEQAQAIMKEWNAAPTTMLFDPEGTTGRAYGARTTPHMYVINPEGTLIYAGAIDDNNSPRPATVEGAKNYVVSALEEAMAGKEISVASTEPYGCSVKYAA